MRRFMAECVATMALVSVVCCVSASGSALAPAAVGATTALVLAFGPVVGGTHNPAVTVARWIREEVTGRTLASTLAAQSLGAVTGALAARGLLQAVGAVPLVVGTDPGRAGAPSPGVSLALVPVEAVGTFLLVLVVSRLQTDGAWQRYGAAVVGLTVMAIMVAAAPVGGGLVNPALSVAAGVAGLVPPASVVAGVAAQLFGAVAAAVAGPVAPAVPQRVLLGVPGRSERSTGTAGRASQPGPAVVPRPRAAGDHLVRRNVAS